RLYSALKWRITGRPTTSGSGQPPAPFFADPRSGVGEPPASPPLTNSSVFTHRTLPALSFALLIHPCQLSHFSLTQRGLRIFPCATEKEARALERDLIRQIEPRLNQTL